MRSASAFIHGLGIAFLLLLARSSDAALLVYEGFDYVPGDSLTNSSALDSGGSFGWGGRWTGVNIPLATNSASSLYYADPVGNVLTTNGGSVVIGVPAGTPTSAQPSRSFNLGTLTGNTYSGLTGPGTYWVSFIMQWIGPATANSPTNQYVRKGAFVFRSGAQTNATSAGTASFTAGSPNALNRLGTPVDTWTTWTGGDAAAGTQNTGLAASTAPLNSPTFVLIRIDLNGSITNDTVYTWFNWTNLTIEPDIATASTTNTTANEDGINNIRFDANGGNASGTNTVLAVDEFRLGNFFADVTPHASQSVLPPTITLQPGNATVTETYPATFSLTAIGTAPIRYQWYFNTNTLLTDQTNTSITISNVQQSNAGTYDCIVSNDGGSVTSSVVTLTVLAPVAPSITAQPKSLTNALGFSAFFSVTASGSAPLSYQWYFNTNTPLDNQTNTLLSFIINDSNVAGAYSVLVSNKFGSVTSSIALLTISEFAPSQLPAFPGAEGGAKLASGGRGGIVYHVTRLDRSFSDTNSGTLRYGLTSANFPANTPRTIVFDVAGTFWLGRYGAERPEYNNGWDTQSRYNIPDNCTIAGETAPGPVIIMGGTTKPAGDNIVIRNVTFAPGYGMKSFNEPDAVPPKVPTPGDFPDSAVYDAMDVSGRNVMLDHLTAIYATDETISCNEQANNLTIQYCTMAQAQNYPQADAENPGTYEGHAFGSLLTAGSDAKISIIKNLYAHLRSRVPRVGSSVGTGPFNDFRNNVIYNWISWAGYAGNGQRSFDNFINNFYLTGPGGDDASGTNIIYTPGQTAIFTGGIIDSTTRAFISGNLEDTNKNGSPTDTFSADAGFMSVTPQPIAFDVNIGATMSASAAFTNVLRYSGARWWARPYDFTRGNTNAITTNDIALYIDERLAKETITGTGKVMAWADDPFNSDPNEGTEWRTMLALRADAITGDAPFNRAANWDSDGDGMPDAWEIEHGLDPYTPNNNGDFDNDGYTDLEEYLNEISAWPAPGTIYFTGDENSRYARIFNWRVFGEQLTITNLGTVTTYSLWQPSRYDTAIISNRTVFVDAVGQDAGTLRLTNNAVLNITNGWLKIATTFDNGASCTTLVSNTGSLMTSNLLNAGTLRLSGSAGFNVSGTFTNTGTLDVMAWNGTLPASLVNLGTILDHNLIVIDSCGLTGTNFTATIHGYTGHTYQLQYRDDLINGLWQNVGTPVSGQDSTIQLLHSGGGSSQQRFYRVAVY